MAQRPEDRERNYRFAMNQAIEVELARQEYMRGDTVEGQG
jgi:hypothetical protein